LIFLYRLCLELGYPHPDHLLAQLTSSQLAGWMTYAALEPFGEYAAEVRHGQQMAQYANYNTSSKSRTKDFQPRDFMNIRYDQQSDEPEQDIETKLEQIFG